MDAYTRIYFVKL